MAIDLTTFVFELVNFLALILLLRWVAYKPLQKAIRARRAALIEREDQTRAALAAAEDKQRQLDHGIQELRRAADLEREKAIEEGASERARILEQARADAAAERARARTMVEFERQAALVWVREATIEQGTALAGRLLVELAPAQVQAILIDRLVGAIASLGEGAADAQEALDGHGASDVVELEVPRAPERDEVERVREALRAVLGRAPEIVVREAPELMAGGVLRVGSHVLDASIGGQLGVLRARARELLGEVEGG